MEHFYLYCVFGNLLCAVLYAALPFRVVFLVALAFGLSLVLYIGAFFYGSEIAVKLIDAHTNSIAATRKSAIETFYNHITYVRISERADDLFAGTKYIITKHGNELVLELDGEKKTSIVLDGCKIALIFPVEKTKALFAQEQQQATTASGEALPVIDKKLLSKKGLKWKKGNFLKISHCFRSVYKGFKHVFLAFSSGWELEEWYYNCFRGSQMNSPPCQQITNTFDYLHLKMKPGVNSESHDATWINAFLARLFFQYHNDAKFLSLVEDEIKEILEKVQQKPKFPRKLVTDLQLIDFNPGTNGPLFSNIKLIEAGSEGSLKISGDLAYHGGVYFQLEVHIYLPVPFCEPRTLVVVISVAVESVSTPFVLHMAGPPSELYWITLPAKPEVQLTVSTDALMCEGGSFVNMPRISEIIKSVIVHEVVDILMFPKIEDFNFPNIKKKKLNKNAHIIEIMHSDELDVQTEPEEIVFEPYQLEPVVEPDASLERAEKKPTEKEKPKEDPFSVKSLFRQMKKELTETIRQNGGF